MEEIFNLIKTSFSSLWQMRMRGNTLEVVTPFATSSNLFVSLFLTLQDDEFVVTDGGWIVSGTYDTSISDDPFFLKTLDFYAEDCEVSSVSAKETTFYYKKTRDIRFIPNLIFDMAEFTRSVVNNSFINFQIEKENKTQRRFTHTATEYLKEIIKADDLKIYKPINERFNQVKFNAIINQKGKVSLVNYVTGSEDSYFMNSLGKSIMKFSALEEHGPVEFVNRKITLVDTKITTYRSERIKPFLSLADGVNNRELVLWDNRELLRELA